MELKDQVINEIKKIYDPEIPVNIYELGLIYDVIVEKNQVKIKMTLTTPIVLLPKVCQKRLRIVLCRLKV